MIKQLYEFLREESLTTKKQLAVKFSISETKVNELLQILIEHGLIPSLVQEECSVSCRKTCAFRHDPKIIPLQLWE